jgi:nucleoside-diphosphate-sugar epimerase
MKALVTGSSGFLGRHFVYELRQQGWDVVGIDTVEPSFPSYMGWDQLSSGSFYYTTENFYEFSSEHAFRNDVIRFDLVIHAAAMDPNRLAIDNSPESHVRNRLLDAAMFDWALDTQQGRVLYLSSCAVLDEDPDEYGLYKLAGEKLATLARQAGLSVSVVRAYSGYGSDQSTAFPFGAFVNRAINRMNPFEIWGDGSQVRDWIHVDDLVNGALAVVESGIEEPVSLCTGVGTSLLDLARMIVNMSGYSPDFAFLGDMPAGSLSRVGNPGQFSRMYQCRVSLEEGIIRALKSRYGHKDEGQGVA